MSRSQRNTHVIICNVQINKSVENALCIVSQETTHNVSVLGCAVQDFFEMCECWVFHTALDAPKQIGALPVFLYRAAPLEV